MSYAIIENDCQRFVQSTSDECAQYGLYLAGAICEEAEERSIGRAIKDNNSKSM